MTQRKHATRLLSLLLAIVMLVGLMPTGFAVEADAEATYTYNFMRLQYGQWSNEGFKPSELTEWGWEEDSKNYHKRETDPFKFYGQSEGVNWVWQSSSANAPEFGPHFVGNPGDWGAYVLRVGANGFFKPTVVHVKHTDGGTFNAYLAPLGVENPRDEKYYIGQFVTKNAALVYANKSELDTVALSAGDYVFTLEVADEDGTPAAWISRIILEPVDGEWIDVNADAVETDMFATASAELSGIPAGAEVEVAINDASVATAELVKDGDNYRVDVTGVYLGETAVNVSVVSGDAKGGVTIPVTVNWKDGYNLTEVFWKDVPESVELEHEAVATATMKFNGIPVSFADADSVEVSIKDENIMRASVEVDEEGEPVITFLAKEVGSTTATITVVYNGVEGTAEIPIACHSRVYNYNFMKLYYGPWSTSAYDPTTITSFDKTTAGSKTEITPKVFSDPWMYSHTTGDGKTEWTASCITYGLSLSGGTGSSVVFKIRLDQAGVYTAVSNHSKDATFQRADIYLAPVDAPNPTAQWYHVGLMDTYEPVLKTFVDQEMGQVVLPAGDYYLTYQFAEKHPKQSNVWMPTAAFKLRTEKILKVTLSHDADETIVMKDGSEEINIAAQKDGEAFDLANFPELVVESDHPEIATAEIDLTTGKMVVSGHELGNAMFTVTGTTFDGDDTIIKIPYEVVPPETFKRVTLTAPESELGVGDTTALELHAYRIDGQEIPAEDLRVYYESNNTAVAMVDASGVITARNNGTATITAYVQNNGSTRQQTFDVTVVGYQALASVELVVPAVITVNTAVSLAAKARYADGTAADLENTDAVITYNLVSGESVQIRNGMLRARARGEIVMNVTVELGGQSITSPNLTIRAEKNGDPAPFSKLVLNADKKVMSVGESVQLKAGVQLTDGTYLYYTDAFKHESNKDNTIALELSNDEVISIDENGMIRALKAGSTVLTLTANVGGEEKTLSMTLVVDEHELESVSVAVAKENILVGEKVEAHVLAKLTNGNAVKESDLELVFASTDDSVAVIEDGYLVAKAEGETDIQVSATMNNVTVTGVLKVIVQDDSLASVTASTSAVTIKPTSEGTQISVSAKTKSGAVIAADALEISYESLTPNVVSVTDTGLIVPAAIGDAKVKVTIQYKGVSQSATVTVKVKDGKTEPTYMTYTKREAARDNIANYEWAKNQAQSSITAADKLIGKEEWLWNLITPQDLPRACNTAARFDPQTAWCHYCNENLASLTGTPYAWLYDVENYPWKLQCPNCRRRFPSNDFGAFYEAGKNEHGFFDYEYAKATASHLLVNKDYPEKGEGWAVDDGWGYVTDEDYEMLLGYGVMKRRQTYIAYYNHWALWHGGAISTNVTNLGQAYAFTGDIKYGRLLAIMIDRIADVYPDMYVSEQFPIMSNSDFNSARGRLIGGIWDTSRSSYFCQFYDYAYPAFDDPWVVNFLSKKAEQYNLGDPRGEHGTDMESRGGVGNDKTSSELIRQNIENNLVREVIDAVINENQIYGNQGMHQSTVAMAAVVLDSMPETSNALDWVLGSGGRVLGDIVGTLNRDGQGDEAAPGYSDTWVSSYSGIVDALDAYDGYDAANLYENVKFLKLMKTNFPLTLVRKGTAPIGDSGSMASNVLNMSMGRLVTAFMKSGDPEIAQYIYFLNGNSTKGIQGNIYTPAKAVADDIQAVIDTYGEYPFDESSAMTGSFGFFGLRDGVYKKDKTDTVDTQRDFWMYFGRSTNHGHPGVMNIGIDAYGMAVSSEFSYPESTSGTPRTLNWDRGTIIHNTVQVNDKQQQKITTGQALHFDGDNDSRVQVMDARAPAVYNETSEYRRTLVMVDFDDEISYGVDFFRIIGGDSHTFSFQTISNAMPKTEKLNLVKQSMGTYAGPLVEYGNYGETSGYDGFYDVHRAASPGNEFSVDFEIVDHRKMLKTPRNIHLRMTQLNDFDLNEVALAKGEPPKLNDNPKSVQFVLVDRRGKNLDSLFTTVFQPYDTNPYIVKEEQVSIIRSGGAAEGGNDVAKAVKVTMKNGRVDYIVYASNNKVQYQVDGQFEFKGFVGVISLEDGVVTYSYLHDGSLIGDLTATAAYTGKVVDFTRELAFENSITIQPNSEMDLDKIIGTYVFVGDKAHSYKIKNATKKADGTVVLDVGDFSFAKSVKDYNNPYTGGYNYDIAVGNAIEIPLTNVESDTPVWDVIPDQAVVVGNTLTVPLKAVAPSGNRVTFELAAEKTGASINSDAATVSFSPAANQVGTNTIGIVAKNGTLQSTIYFNVEVYPATSSGGGGGGAGGGGDTSDEVTYTDNGDNTFTGSDGSLICAGPDKTTGTADDITNVIIGEDGKHYIKNADGTLVGAGADGLLGTADDAAVEGEVAPGEKFVDLGNHAWAKDAIYRLVEAGVIKGVADDRFAPAAQITRADFAILLVRAWNLTADEVGTFDDVAASDYFANEVGIAAANGIVKGVGEGKFAPRAPITREQMMVMLHRTLTAQGIKLDAADEAVLATFSDADAISDYAVDAVKLMVANGYIQGSNGKINPQGNATRAEVAVLLDRILNK